MIRSAILNCIVLLGLLQLSCSKQAEDAFKTLPVATIIFSLPAPNAVYSNGDSITFKARAVSTADIHGYDLAIRKAGETNNIYFIHTHNHNDTLDIVEKWKSEVVTPANLEAEIAVYLDHENHTKKEKIGFRVQ